MNEVPKTQYEVILRGGLRYKVDADEAGVRKDGAREVVRFWKSHERVATFNADHVVAYGREGTVSEPENALHNPYVVTLPSEIGEPSSFAVFADELVLNQSLRVYEFRLQGRLVVQIAQELVIRYMLPPQRNAQEQQE